MDRASARGRTTSATARQYRDRNRLSSKLPLHKCPSARICRDAWKAKLPRSERVGAGSISRASPPNDRNPWRSSLRGAAGRVPQRPVSFLGRRSVRCRRSGWDL